MDGAAQCRVDGLIREMMQYEKGVTARINHFMKVYAFARTIGGLEDLPDDQLEPLLAAAVVHDVGIRASLEKYQSSGGHFQEIEGPPVARGMLEKLGFSDAVVERVCWLVAHHHSYGGIEGVDHRILVEADFLVNLHEEKASKETIGRARKSVFRTKAGTELLCLLFGLE